MLLYNEIPSLAATNVNKWNEFRLRWIDRLEPRGRRLSRPTSTMSETYLRVTPILGHGGVHFRRWRARDTAHRHTTAAVQVWADPRRLRRTVAHRKSVTKRERETSGYYHPSERNLRFESSSRHVPYTLFARKVVNCACAPALHHEGSSIPSSYFWAMGRNRSLLVTEHNV